MREPEPATHARGCSPAPISPRCASAATASATRTSSPNFANPSHATAASGLRDFAQGFQARGRAQPHSPRHARKLSPPPAIAAECRHPDHRAFVLGQSDQPGPARRSRTHLAATRCAPIEPIAPFLAQCAPVCAIESAPRGCNSPIEPQIRSQCVVPSRTSCGTHQRRSMSTTRSFLLVALAFVAFLNWEAWQKDYAPQPALRCDRRARHPPHRATTSSAEIPQTRRQRSAGCSRDHLACADRRRKCRTVGARPRAHRPARSRHRHARRHRWCKPTCSQYPIDPKEKDHPVRLLDTAPATFFVAQDGLVSTTVAPDHQAQFTVRKERLRTRRRRRQARSAADWQDASGLKVRKVYIFTRGQLPDRNAQRNQQRHAAAWTGNEYRQLQRVPPIVSTQRLLASTIPNASPSPARRGTARRTSSRSWRSTSSPTRRSTAASPAAGARCCSTTSSPRGFRRPRKPTRTRRRSSPTAARRAI